MIEAIDLLARSYPKRNNLEELRKYLIHACPLGYQTQKGLPEARYIKAVKEYIGELAKVQEWNNISIH